MQCITGDRHHGEMYQPGALEKCGWVWFRQRVYVAGSSVVPTGSEKACVPVPFAGSLRSWPPPANCQSEHHLGVSTFNSYNNLMSG